MSINLTIPVAPLSVNKAYRGRRFSTSEHKQLQKDVSALIGQWKVPLKGELAVVYVFYVKNYSRSDVGNMEKTITDILCKLGYIQNDNDIKSLYLIKEKVSDSKNEKIEVQITNYIC